MLQPPPQWPSLPALSLPCVSLHVSWSRVSPLEGAQRDELPRGKTPASPPGLLHACHLLAEPGREPVCHASDRLGGGQWGHRGWGWGMTAGTADACWSHRGPPWKHLPPPSPTALLQLVVDMSPLPVMWLFLVSCGGWHSLSPLTLLVMSGSASLLVTKPKSRHIKGHRMWRQSGILNPHLFHSHHKIKTEIKQVKMFLGNSKESPMESKLKSKVFQSIAVSLVQTVHRHYYNNTESQPSQLNVTLKVPQVSGQLKTCSDLWHDLEASMAKIR